MTEVAFRSRMGAYVMEVRNRRAEFPEPSEILGLSLTEMADELVEADVWSAFVDQYGVVRVGDAFYDPEGLIE